MTYYERRELRQEAEAFKTLTKNGYMSREKERIRRHPERYYNVLDAYARMSAPEPDKFTAPEKNFLKVIRELNAQGEKDQANKLIKQFKDTFTNSSSSV